MALRLARDGWELALADLDTEGNRETLRLVEEAGGSGRLETLDVADADAWADLRNRLQSEWPRLDAVFNNAGVGGAGDVGEFSLDDWRWMLDINLYGVIYGCHTMLPWLKENPARAHIVNTASIAPFVTIPGMAAYNVSKAGVVLLSETLYGELQGSNVSVTVTCPTMVATQILSRGRYATPRLQAMADRQMAQSRLTAEQVADLTIRAMHRRKLYVLPGLRAKMFWRLKRMAPQGFMDRVAAAYRKANRHSSKDAASSRK
jgi:NAD(P)-dependent dehydrogenase (short-subunit alcohol dehydrogenase family)